RRATAGPAEKTFSTLVGLQFNPRRLRDAAALFAYLQTQGGAEARDKVFSHPDLLPTTQDLDDPLGYSERRQAEWTNESSIDEAMIDEALSRIRAEGLDGADGSSEPDPVEDSATQDSTGSAAEDSTTEDPTGTDPDSDDTDDR